MQIERRSRIDAVGCRKPHGKLQRSKLEPELGSWLEGAFFLKLPTLRPKGYHLDLLPLGQAPTHPSEAMINIKVLQQTGHAIDGLSGFSGWPA